MAQRNAPTPADKRIEFRIGINMGDVVVEDRDIFGDGVNWLLGSKRYPSPVGSACRRGSRKTRQHNTTEGLSEANTVGTNLSTTFSEVAASSSRAATAVVYLLVTPTIYLYATGFG